LTSVPSSALAISLKFLVNVDKIIEQFSGQTKQNVTLKRACSSEELKKYDNAVMCGCVKPADNDKSKPADNDKSCI
jgi:hypothetical protein